MRDNNVIHDQRRMVFYRAFVFVTIFYFTAGDGLTKKNDKRLGNSNNFQACLDSFDIHKDKIIKTQDSREMGAKYLTEVDVDSRQDCLKSCCDTDRCDVFIFEEKKPGSCYLFQCGPLHDFKCKFTSHANYTSAVRTNYNVPSNNNLQGDIQISQQEHELKSLRKLGDSVAVGYSFTEPPAKAIATQTPKLILTTPTLVKSAGCSHNQYECRSSGDCIAIYNVCDGIPQCADGSDEAAELVCPTEKPTMSPAVVMQGPIQPSFQSDIAKYQQTMIDPRKVYPKSWDFPNLAHQAISQQQSLLYPAQQMELPQLRKSFGSPGYQWDYQPILEQNKVIYNVPNSFRETNNMNPYEQEQPHIFNHKSPGVMEENEAESGASYSEPKRPYTSHFSSPNRGVWQEGQVQQIPITSVTPNFQRKEVQQVPKETKSTTVPPCDTSNEHADSSIVHMEHKEEPKEERVKSHGKHSNENIGKTSIASKSEPIKHNRLQPNELKDHKSVIVIEDHPRDHERSILISEHLQQTTELEVLRPKGAVISLALGLTATAITAALIACRLRVVRRRGRRGHGPYAHDADYLVNGMYL